MKIEQNFSLAEFTTFKIGGPAAFFVSVGSLDQLQEAMQFARAKSLPVFALGRGSNVLISDEGFDGLVIKNDIQGLQIQPSGLLKVGAGENWDDVVAAVVEKNLA